MRTKGHPARPERRTTGSVAEHPLLAVDEPAADTSADAVGPRPDAGAAAQASGPHLTRLQIAAVACAIASLVVLAVGWFGASTKVEVWEQIPYLISGGFGAAVLLGLGITAYVAHEHAEDRRERELLAQRVERLESQLQEQLHWRLDELEMALAAEFDALSARLGHPTSARGE